MIRCICIVLAINACLSACCQTLRKGDTISMDIAIKSGLDFSTKKLTILDFWGHSCSSCIKSIPKINLLQKQFADDVKIVFVAQESRDSTDKMFRIRPWLEVPTVEMLHEDTLLLSQFDVKGLPLIVWVNQEAVIEGITYGQALHASNIENFLNGDGIKAEEVREIDRLKSLFDERYDEALQGYSYIARSSIDTQIGYVRDSLKIRRGIFLNHYSMRDLFVYAYERYSGRPFNRKWHVVSSVSKSAEKQDSNASYYYELRTPDGQEGEKYKKMIADLEYFFNVKSSIDTILMEVIIMKGQGQFMDKMKAKGGRPIDTFRKNSEFISANSVVLQEDRLLKNVPYSVFSSRVKGLIERNEGKPFIDKVNYNGNVDVKFDGITFDFYSLEGLEGELDKYGLYLDRKSVV